MAGGSAYTPNPAIVFMANSARPSYSKSLYEGWGVSSGLRAYFSSLRRVGPVTGTDGGEVFFVVGFEI